MWGRVEGGEQRREPSGPESLQAVAQPLGLSGAPVHEASLCEAQRLVQDGARGVCSQPPHPPGGPEPTWPLTPNCPLGRCSLCLEQWGLWVCLFYFFTFLDPKHEYPASLHPQAEFGQGHPGCRPGTQQVLQATKCLRLSEMSFKSSGHSCTVYSSHKATHPNIYQWIMGKQIGGGSPPHSRILLSHEKEWSSDTCYHRDEL